MMFGSGMIKTYTYEEIAAARIKEEERGRQEILRLKNLDNASLSNELQENSDDYYYGPSQELLDEVTKRLCGGDI